MTRIKNIKDCNCDDIPSLDEQYKSIMENFDFLHVQQMMTWEKARVEYDEDFNHMRYDQWKMMVGRDFKVPTVKELRDLASKQLKSAIDFAKKNPRNKFYMTGSGPFKTICRYGVLELTCDFESWSCD